MLPIQFPEHLATPKNPGEATKALYPLPGNIALTLAREAKSSGEGSSTWISTETPTVTRIADLRPSIN